MFEALLRPTPFRLLFLASSPQSGIDSGVNMAVRTVKAKEILEDLQSGCRSEALKTKYKLTDQGLENLLRKLREAGYSQAHIKASRTVIGARELLDDIQAGLGRTEIMEKRGISLRSLQALVSLFIDAAELRREDLYSRLDVIRGDTVLPESFREAERHYPDFDTPVYDASCPEVHGRVVDLTEHGIGVIGIDTDVGARHNFVVLGDPYGETSPFQFEVECKWVKGPEPGKPVLAGYQIIGISDKDKSELQTLVKMVTFDA